MQRYSKYLKRQNINNSKKKQAYKMKNKSLEQKNVQNENKMRGNVWKFLWTPKFGQIKMPAARQA